jgi:hypothetical protein
MGIYIVHPYNVDSSYFVFLMAQCFDIQKYGVLQLCHLLHIRLQILHIRLQKNNPDKHTFQ